MRLTLAVSCAMMITMTSARAQEAQTLKERLSDKASDAQRVDNCHVPPDRRGALPRPDCPDKPPTTTSNAQSSPR
ncbi:MAG: hypothetical protein JO320_10415 [Alphaproteobacteria bacterium]|nr:hypothetical protein [Alphaproteobacteria bacterium]